MKNYIEIIKKGGIGVMPTDTILGIIGSAFSKKAVKRIYEVRGRDKNKPLIILIENISELKKFGIKNIPEKELKKIWPNKVSIIFEAKSTKFKYLHRDTNTLCFRMPKNKFIQSILKKTGPLVAPSANPQGKPFAKNITEAKKYFGDKVDFFIKNNSKNTTSSTILKYLSKEKVFELVREGDVTENGLRSKILIK
ncbi:MAG: L-threonylcarbamoyladenylate synthase [Candidatus Paceibacterota bacterium]